MNLRSEKTFNEKQQSVRPSGDPFGALMINSYPREEDYPEIVGLTCQKETLTANLSDGRIITVPTVWFSRLREASEQQLQNFEILPDGYGISWEDLDEDISVKAFIKGLNN